MGNTSSAPSHTLSVELHKISVFRNTDREFYRIPALIYINDTRTFLAFAEKRTSLADVDAECLVVRRGTKQQDGNVEWSDVKEIPEACTDKYRTMNPCPVYEKQTKTVFLFFNCVYDKVTEQQQIKQRQNQARLCYVKSTDSGVSWSDFKDLTVSVIGDEIKNWATFSVGPGHGIQMADGRLIIPAYAYYISGSVQPHAFVFYSDDRGDTWTFGHKVNSVSLECEMAEITKSNGQSSLYCNARCTGATRVEVCSQNRGGDFDSNSCPSKLVETGGGCQGSVVSFKHGDESWLIYSHPTDRKERKDLGVYVNTSPFSDSRWNNPHVINSGYSAYSDLTQSSDTDDRFACLLERGNSNVDEIAFVEFSLKDSYKSKKASYRHTR